MQFADPAFTINNKALRTERLVCGLLSLALAAGLGAAAAVCFAGQWLYVIGGVAAAVALSGLAVWQLAMFPVLKRLPYSLVLTADALIVREKRAYHYIRFADLGQFNVNCPHFSGHYAGPGYERLDIIDGEIYYYIGEMKKRFATREAEVVGKLIFDAISGCRDEENR